VRDLVDDVARAVAARADALGAEVAVDADATIARIDCDLVRRLLDNLVESALRQVGKGDRIQLAARGEGPERLRLAVRHTGRDIPARVQSRLFEPEGGTGLGLYVCRLVAEAHAGSISLVARAGWTVSFEVVLPLGADARSL
jgi:two-component system, OmpR family, sensor kinase